MCRFGCIPVLSAEAGSRPGGRGTFLCFAKETYPKERRPCCLRPLRFAAGQPGVLGCGVRRGTHCAPAALRSNNHGESVDEAGMSCGTPATPRPARPRRIQKGWGANSPSGRRCARPEPLGRKRRALRRLGRAQQWPVWLFGCLAVWLFGCRAFGLPTLFWLRLRRGVCGVACAPSRACFVI